VDCSILSIAVTFAASKVLLAPMGGNLWFTLSVIISCGTLPPRSSPS